MGGSCGKKSDPESAVSLPPPPVKSAMKAPSNESNKMTDEEMEREAEAVKSQALARGKMLRPPTNNGGVNVHARRKSKSIMTQLAIKKFPLIRKAFDLIHDEWVKLGCEGQEKTITRENLGGALKAICKKNFTEEEVSKLFDESDLDHSKSIAFREFLIAVSIGYFIDVQSDDSHVIDIQKGILATKDAFHMIDVDGGGSIDHEELKTALFDSVGSDSQILEQRFAELDFNHDSSIEFPEFVYALISWVGFMDME